MANRMRQPCQSCGGAKPAGYGRQFCDPCLDAIRVTRFWAKVDKRGPDECWPWLANLSVKGYGQFTYRWRQPVQAHRAAYMLTRGDIPDGLVVRHRCDNPPCCNPTHLELGTYQDNRDDARIRGRDRRGEQVSATLTDADVIRMRAERAAGAPRKELAATYGVAVSTVSSICTGQSWRHLPLAPSA